MSRPRIIARLDIKGDNVVRGVHLEGLRVVGKPEEMAGRYTAAGIDELVFIDTVATLYGRNNTLAVVERTAETAFLPMTVGGGIRTLDDVAAVLRVGADKVALNSAAVRRPEFVAEIARAFGSQAVVASLEVKRMAPGSWTVLIENGREPTGKDAIAWIQEVQEHGAGEILLTSIDGDGTRKGTDLELVRAASRVAKVPLIVSGGFATVDHVVAGFNAGADAVALGTLLHFKLLDVGTVKTGLRAAGVQVAQHG